MSIFNFKKFNESLSQPKLNHEHLEIFNDLIDDLLSFEEEISTDRPFRNTKPEVEFGNIILRTSMTFASGQVASVLGEWSFSHDRELKELKSSIYGFSIRQNKKLPIKRLFELFKSETGIQLRSHLNDERKLIIAEPHVINFIDSLVSFEQNLEYVNDLLATKYHTEVEIEFSDNELLILFPAEEKSSQIGCYLDCDLERGRLLGADLPIDHFVKYKLKIGRLWNFVEGRDNKSLQSLSPLKDSEHEFTFDIDDIESSSEELIEFIDKNILSLLEDDYFTMFDEVESQIKSLKKYQINVGAFEYLKPNLIELELNWKQNDYHFHIRLNQLSNKVELKNVVSIWQQDSPIASTNLNDLAETIYLSLIDGKLKITE